MWKRFLHGSKVVAIAVTGRERVGTNEKRPNKTLQPPIGATKVGMLQVGSGAARG
jgi:hypothetical protein